VSPGSRRGRAGSQGSLADRLFTPDDAIGPDGKKHALIGAWRSSADRYVPGLVSGADTEVMASVYDSERLAAGMACGWCRSTLKAVFADGDVTVVIPGYVATLALAAR
jgi:hypothetical protein